MLLFLVLKLMMLFLAIRQAELNCEGFSLEGELGIPNSRGSSAAVNWSLKILSKTWESLEANVSHIDHRPSTVPPCPCPVVLVF